MSRHTIPQSYQLPGQIVFNHPLPETYFQTQHSQPMSPQYSNRSYESISSSSYSYGSNQRSYASTTPPQHDSYVCMQGRHHSQGAAYTNETCISPLELHPQNFDPQNSYEHQRILPSSDHRHMAESESSFNKAAAQKAERRRHDGSNSNSTEKDNLESKSRVPCEWIGCKATFSRKADVNRHISSTHENIQFIDCDVNNCARKGKNGFNRKDHLLEHKRGYHCMDLPKRHVRNNNKNRHESS